MLGTTQALYFQITDYGLHGERGDFYLATGRDAELATKCLANAKQIGRGCWLYADDHDDKFPKNLNDLVPDYLRDLRVLHSPFSPDTNDIGYEYFGGKRTDPPDNVLLRARFPTKDDNMTWESGTERNMRSSKTLTM